MELKKITAIVRCDQLEDVENRLKGPIVPGISVDHVKGYGEYANFMARDWMSATRGLRLSSRNAVRSGLSTPLSMSSTRGRRGIVYAVPIEEATRIRDRPRVRALEAPCPRCRATVRVRRRQHRKSASVHHV